MAQHTQGPWHAFNMVGEDGQPMTAEQLGEYVKNSVLKSIEDGGASDRFLFISTGDGDPDICHVGNGPRGPFNAALIAAAPDLLEVLKSAEVALAAELAMREAAGDVNDAGYEVPVGPVLASVRAAIARAEAR